MGLRSEKTTNPIELVETSLIRILLNDPRRDIASSICSYSFSSSGYVMYVLSGLSVHTISCPDLSSGLSSLGIRLGASIWVATQNNHKLCPRERNVTAYVCMVSELDRCTSDIISSSHT